MDGRPPAPDDATAPAADAGETGIPRDPSDPAAPAFDEAGLPLPARSFAPGLDDASVGVTVVAPVGGPACGWCGMPLPAPDIETCPGCGAALHPAADLPEIPGVTVTPPDVRRAVRDVSPEVKALVAPPITDEIARVGARPALSPPDRRTRLAMLELELQALRAEVNARNAEAAAEAAAGEVPDAQQGRMPAPDAAEAQPTSPDVLPPGTE